MMLFSGPQASRIEDRLDMFTGVAIVVGAKTHAQGQQRAVATAGRLPTMLAQLFASFGKFDVLFEQADTTLTVGKLALFSSIGPGRRSGVAIS